MKKEDEDAGKYTEMYIREIARIARMIDIGLLNKMVALLADVRAGGGRIFFLGVGGGAGNASHAVNDFRKIAGIEAYAPTDNVSEITARVNDEGWDTVFIEWLKCSRLSSRDCIFIFSVGGGSEEKNVSRNLVLALKYARGIGAKIAGVVGKDGGYTAKSADVAIIVPTVNESIITPFVESFQSVIFHLLVSHPALRTNTMKWESMTQMEKAVFLDRDGVINMLVFNPATGEFEPPHSINDLQVCPDVIDGLKMILTQGYLLFLVSNQPDYAKGKAAMEDILTVHDTLDAILARAGIFFTKYYYCYHHPGGTVPGFGIDCECRKPKPYFILEAQKTFKVDLKYSWMVGDQDTDMECGISAGLQTILIENNDSLSKRGKSRPDFRTKNFAGAVEVIMNRFRTAKAEA